MAFESDATTLASQTGSYSDVFVHEPDPTDLAADLTGDAAKIFGPEGVRIAADEETELILIDVPVRYTPVGVWAR